MRTRERRLNYVAGSKVSQYFGNEDRNWSQQYEVCTDDVSPGDNLFFQVTRYKALSEFSASGEYNSYPGYGDLTKVSLTRFPILVVPNTSFFPGNVPDMAPDGYYAAELLARTNPSRPVVDLPVFIAELKDIPLLIKVMGDNVIQTMSKANLSYWFGWKPLVSDILKLCNFSEAVNKRHKELKVLYTRGLSCTRNLDSVATEHEKEVFQSSLGTEYVTYKNRQLFQYNVSGHVKWKPTTLPPKTDQEMINLARKAALGLELDPSTAWELIPFSWLVDWFSSVGAFLNAHRNAVPAEPYDVSIMRHQQCWNYLTRQSNPVGVTTPSSGVILWEDKSRKPASASISAYLPMLSTRQLSILGSLWVLKTKGGYLRN